MNPKDFFKKKASEKAKRLADKRAARARKDAARRENTFPDPVDPDNPTPQEEFVREHMDYEHYPEMWVLEHCAYSDYSGSLVEKSNGEVLKERFPGLFDDASGGMGTVWVGIPDDNVNSMTQEQMDEILEIAQGLEGYPFINDDHFSQLEYEAKAGEWNKEGRKELREALAEKWDVLPMLGALYSSDQEFDTILGDMQLDYDQFMLNEHGDSIYFQADKMAEKVESEPFEKYAEEQPLLSGAERKAFAMQADDFAKLLASAHRNDPEVKRRVSEASVDALWRVFKWIEAKYDVGWDLDKTAWISKDDPNTPNSPLVPHPEKNFDLAAEMKNQVKGVTAEDIVRALRAPEPENQLVLPLESYLETMRIGRQLTESILGLLEGFKEKKAAFVAAGADPAEVDSVIRTFKQLKNGNMLSDDEKDIDRYQSFEDLKAVVDEAGKRTRSPSAKTRNIPIRPDAELVSENAEWVVVSPNTADASKFYSSGTTWCIGMEDGHWFRQYRKELNKHYIFISRMRPSSDAYYKMCATVKPSGGGISLDCRDAQNTYMTDAAFRKVTGVDPRQLPPFKWQDMPPKEMWRVAKRTGVKLRDFMTQITPEVWAEIGNSMVDLRAAAMADYKKDHPEASEEEVGRAWTEFWTSARQEGLDNPGDDDYFGTLSYYLDMMESKRSVPANVLLEEILSEFARGQDEPAVARVLRLPEGRVLDAHLLVNAALGQGGAAEMVAESACGSVPVYEGFKERKKLFVDAGASPEDVDAAFVQFRQLKARNLLTDEEKDIDRYGTLEELQAVLTDASGRESKSRQKSKAFKAKMVDWNIVYESAKALVAVPKTYEQATEIGMGTKWCVTMKRQPTKEELANGATEGEPIGLVHWNRYAADGLLHYMAHIKGRPQPEKHDFPELGDLDRPPDAPQGEWWKKGESIGGENGKGPGIYFLVKDPEYKVVLTLPAAFKHARDSRSGGGGEAFIARDSTDSEITVGKYLALTGMQPNDFGALAYEVFSRLNQPFAKFLQTVSPEVWQEVGKHLTKLQEQWMSDTQESGEAATEADFMKFWESVLPSALENIEDAEYLTSLQDFLATS